MQYHGHTVTPIEFMKDYLGDHDKTCSECGYEAPVRTKWDVRKQDEDGVYFHHVCPNCGAVEDIHLDPARHRERDEL